MWVTLIVDRPIASCPTFQSVVCSRALPRANLLGISRICSELNQLSVGIRCIDRFAIAMIALSNRDVLCRKTLLDLILSGLANSKSEMYERRLLMGFVLCCDIRIGKREKGERSPVSDAEKGVDVRNLSSREIGKFGLFNPGCHERQTYDIFIEVSCLFLICAHIRIVVKPHGQLIQDSAIRTHVRLVDHDHCSSLVVAALLCHL